MLKLVHIYDPDDDDSDSDSDVSTRTIRSEGSFGSLKWPRRLFRRLRRAIRSEGPNDKFHQEPQFQLRSQPTGFSDDPDISQLRTLQRYHAPPNSTRIEYMERHSALASRHLAVACEQVSVFLTNDNCIISFFEQSAQDIELPIIHRLQTTDTIIRQ